MRAQFAGFLALGFCLALPVSHLRAEDQTHRMYAEFTNESDLVVTLSSEGTKITDGDVDNGAFDDVEIPPKKGQNEYTADWQIKLCPPEQTDTNDPETSEKEQLFSLRVSYTYEPGGIEDVTLCTVTYRYDLDKTGSSGKSCILRKKSLTTPDDNVSDADNVYTPGGGSLRDHTCVDDNVGGAHIRALKFKSTH